MVKKAQRLAYPFADIMQYLLESYETVPELYRLESRFPWSKENRSVESKEFVAKRLAAASQMLANLWYTAWLNSELPVPATKR